MHVPFTTANRRVYTFLKQSGDVRLEPQFQMVLNTIQQHSPLNKYELIHHLAAKMETKQNISELVSRVQRLLIAYGFIRVEEYKDWKERVELEKDRTMNAMIIPSGMGGFSLKIGEYAPFGHWPTVDAARDVLRRSGVTPQNVTPELLEQIASGTI